MITVDDLTKRRGARTVVSDVTFAQPLKRSATLMTVL
jgi:hypothetical protein